MKVNLNNLNNFCEYLIWFPLYSFFGSIQFIYNYFWFLILGGDHPWNDDNGLKIVINEIKSICNTED